MDVLRERHEKWRAAVNARDIDAYSELVIEDVVWIPPAGDAIVGRKAFQEWLKPFFESYDYEYSASNTRLLAAGEWIVERSDFESRMTPIAGGSTMSHTGVYMAIWRLDSDGIWRIDRYVDQGPLSGD